MVLLRINLMLQNPHSLSHKFPWDSNKDETTSTNTIVHTYSHLRYCSAHLPRSSQIHGSQVPECFFLQNSHKHMLNHYQHCPLLIFVTSNISMILFMHLSLSFPNFHSCMQQKILELESIQDIG